MIDKRLWFYKDNSELCKKHREAYEKSLNCNHAVKVHSKMYYYKGYDVGYYVGKRDGYIEAITDILKYLEPYTNTPAIIIKRHIEEMKEEGYNEGN